MVTLIIDCANRIDGKRTDPVNGGKSKSTASKNHAKTNSNGHRLEAWRELAGKIDVAACLQNIDSHQHRFTETVVTNLIETEGEPQRDLQGCHGRLNRNKTFAGDGFDIRVVFTLGPDLSDIMQRDTISVTLLGIATKRGT